jgi:hypothetical protein
MVGDVPNYGVYVLCKSKYVAHATKSSQSAADSDKPVRPQIPGYSDEKANEVP